MPVTCGHRDKDGPYCIWGTHGKHYHYTLGDDASKEAARKKANEQGAAAHASGYEGSEKSIEEKKEDEKKPKVPNPDEPGEEADPGEETEEESKKKSYEVPKSIDELKEGHIVKYNNKIGIIRKVIS